MKCVFILLVIGIFGQSIFAIEQTEADYKHNQNLTIVLYDKVVNQLNKIIPIFTDWDEFLIPYAKAKEEALNEFNIHKMGNGDHFFDELKHDLDKLDTTFFDTLGIIHESIIYYYDGLQILKLTYTRDEARREMKKRALDMFDRKASLKNPFYYTFAHKFGQLLDKLGLT